MIPRIAFLLIAAFWIAMNVMLWRSEYVRDGAGIQVPVTLVLQKVLTAPDISSLTVFQNGERIGFCEFSTSVEQEMAALDEGKPVPEGVNNHVAYQIRFNGNVGLGDFTNRLTFNGLVEFTRQRAWRELNLKVSSHYATIEIHSALAERTVHLTITSDDLSTDRVFRFDDLGNPAGLVRSFAGSLGSDPVGGLDLPVVPGTPAMLAHNIHWEAHLDRLTIGRESVPAYRLEARVLDHPIVIYVSTLGEILRLELPDGVVAAFDQLGNP